jgi:hypothetical protein
MRTELLSWPRAPGRPLLGGAVLGFIRELGANAWIMRRSVSGVMCGRAAGSVPNPLTRTRAGRQAPGGVSPMTNCNGEVRE